MTTKSITAMNNFNLGAIMKAAQDSKTDFTGIKTVCASLTHGTDENGTFVRIEWTAADETVIQPMQNRNRYAGDALLTLYSIWGIEPKFTQTEDGNVSIDNLDELQNAMNEETREVMFTVRHGINKESGEPWTIRSFRKPNAIDRAKQKTAEINAQ